MRIPRFMGILALASLMGLGGCQAVAYIAAQFAPPKKVKTVTELVKAPQALLMTSA